MRFVTIDDIPSYSDAIIRYVCDGVGDLVDEVDFERFTSAEDFLSFLEDDPDYIADIVFCDVEMGAEVRVKDVSSANVLSGFAPSIQK